MIPRAKKNTINENDLMMYLAVGLKHLRLVVLLMYFSLLLGLVYYNFTKPVYYSKAIVDYKALERAVTDNTAFKDSSDRAIRAQLESPYLIERTARKLGVNASAKDIAKRHLKKIRVAFDTDRNLIIEAWPHTYEWARDWAPTMIQEYLLDREEKRVARARLTIETFSKEMAEMKNRMDNIFNLKHDFRNSNELTQIIIELNHLKQIPRDLLVIKQQLSMLEGTRHILKEGNLDVLGRLSLLSSVESDLQAKVSIGDAIPKDGDNSAPIIVVPQMVESTSKRPWEDLDKERRRLDQENNQLSRVFLARHPKVLAVRKQLDDVERALQLELEVALNRFDLTYANLTSKKRELEDKLPEYNEVMRRHEKYVQEYNSFDSGELAWQRMHAEMEKRLNVLDFGEDKERVTIKFLGFAEPLKDYPVSPHRLKLIIYSLILGLALSIAVPFLIEYLDSRVSDVEQVEETLRIRGLGVVPKIDESDVEGSLMVGDSKADYHLQENFRVIRTNLAINSETGVLPQVILVTSAMPQEGKTVVSSNLAMSFAMKGEKTLLIDGDLRRGRLHRVFAASNKPGLSDVLRDKRPLEEAFRPTPNENLTLMTCGKHLNSASELLDSPSFAKLIEDLRGKYERIIIDTPPVLGLAETAIIQRLADGILFVIWSDFTPIRNVKAALQSLQNNGAKFAGFVLNRLDFHTLGNRYKYFYYAPNYYTNYKAIEAAPTAHVEQ
jgi:succinoglycan biosynthesis transport protein ExoP